MRKITLISLLLVFFVFGSLSAQGQQEMADTGEDWPSGNVTIVCSSRAGGFADYHARTLADYIQRTTGEATAVLNISEGGGSVGAETVRVADPDGLTLYYMHDSFPITCYTGVTNIDPDVDMTPIRPVVNPGNNAIVVRSDAPWDSLDELVADAKNRPNEILWGAMAGATTHFMKAKFEEASETQFKLVDAGSEPEKVTALLGGHIDICNVGMRNADQYTKSGDMKVLCITGKEKDPVFPEFPTAIEQGYDFFWDGEFYLYGPAGMSDELVDTINNALIGYGTKDEVSRNALAKYGTFLVTERTTEEALAFMKDRHATLKAMAKELGF